MLKLTAPIQDYWLNEVQKAVMDLFLVKSNNFVRIDNERNWQ